MSKNFFIGKATAFQANLGDKLLVSDNFPTNSAGAVILAKAMLGVDQLRYKVAVAPELENLVLED